MFVSGLDQLLDENRISDMTLIYSLFQRVREGLKELCVYFGNFIKVRVGSSVERWRNRLLQLESTAENISRHSSDHLLLRLQKTGRLFVINPENDGEKDKEMVQQLLGEFTFLSSLELPAKVGGGMFFV